MKNLYQYATISRLLEFDLPNGSNGDWAWVQNAHSVTDTRLLHPLDSLARLNSVCSPGSYYKNIKMNSYTICINFCILLMCIKFSDANDIENMIANIPFIKPNIFSKSRDFKDSLNTPCTCGIFLEGQLSDDGHLKFYENPVFSKEMDLPLYPCGVHGNKQCMKKCIDMVINYMPNIGPLVCSSIDRDCVKEKPYLFTKNCEGTWRNTGFSAGKEFCCHNGVETKCRLGAMSQKQQQQQQQPSSFLSLLNKPSQGKSVPEILIGFVDRATDLASGVLNLANGN
ncbi:follicle cell protein 3C [Arctopsyche grandis]|uniref:follicle cell protein 3C n=1 Tax=Arctopsyche grandis TaxID=121162 RepID=UPI00406D972D